MGRGCSWPVICSSMALVSPCGATGLAAGAVGGWTGAAGGVCAACCSAAVREPEHQQPQLSI